MRNEYLLEISRTQRVFLRKLDGGLVMQELGVGMASNVARIWEALEGAGEQVVSVTSQSINEVTGERKYIVVTRMPDVVHPQS